MLKSILDVFLYPKMYFKRITERKFTLLLGILFVGSIDVTFFFLIDNFFKLFKDRPPEFLVFNIFLLCFLIPLIGFVDIFFFSLPLFDLFMIFKKEEGTANNTSVVKVMKIYISAHFLMPVISILVYLVNYNTYIQKYTALVYIIAIVALIWPYWFSAIVYRGINVIYNFKPLYRSLVFLVVVLWSLLISYTMEFITSSWLFVLFK